jgi:hypothetical protein
MDSLSALVEEESGLYSVVAIRFFGEEIPVKAVSRHPDSFAENRIEAGADRAGAVASFSAACTPDIRRAVEFFKQSAENLSVRKSFFPKLICIGAQIIVRVHFVLIHNEISFSCLSSQKISAAIFCDALYKRL